MKDLIAKQKILYTTQVFYFTSIVRQMSKTFYPGLKDMPLDNPPMLKFVYL